MAKMHLKSSTKWKKIAIYTSEMAKMHLKSSTMVEENFEIYTFEMAKMHLKSSTMVGENFEIYTSEMAKMYLKSSTMVGAKQWRNIFCVTQKNTMIIPTMITSTKKKYHDNARFPGVPGN